MIILEFSLERELDNFCMDIYNNQKKEENNFTSLIKMLYKRASDWQMTIHMNGTISFSIETETDRSIYIYIYVWWSLGH